MDEFGIRPYFKGLVAHPQTLSSIILFTDKVHKVNATSSKDFLTNFSNPISGLFTTISSDQSNVVAGMNSNFGNIYVSTLDGVNNYYGVFNNFSIMAVREADDEIVKIHQNFDNSWNAFFFGKRPRIYSFNGLFIDSPEYPYYQEFMVAYDKLLSGGKCVENKTKMFLACDGKIIEGYMINISATSTYETSFKKDFSFSLLVRNVYWVRNNLIAKYDNNTGKISYGRSFNGMSNLGRLNLNELGLDFASGV